MLTGWDYIVIGIYLAFMMGIGFLWSRINKNASDFSAADIQLSFVIEAGAMRGPVADYPNLVQYKDRFRARPAYQRALERGGPYKFAEA